MIIQSQVNTASTEFKDNARQVATLATMLLERRQQVAQGGGEKAVAHFRKQNKLLPRERIRLLLDPGSSFLELGMMAAWDHYEGQAPSAGIVTGIGSIHGHEVMVVANDGSVKGGSYFPLTVKKHLRAQEVAMENRLPCVYLVDSGGAFLPLQDEVFPDRDHFGRIFYNQARMSAEGLLQVSVVLGFCTAGGAYVPAMSDESIMVKGQGSIFLAGPPLVKAATGEEISVEELGGAEVHCRVSGVADHMAGSEKEALERARAVFAHLPHTKKLPWEPRESREPLYDPKEIAGIIGTDFRKSFEVREVIARLVDGSEFEEFKSLYATTLVTGFSHLGGFPVGILANNGVLFGQSALKATHFIQMCCERKIPLLFLQNITGFMVGREAEHSGIAKDGAKMVNAVATSHVPRFTVVMGGSFGAGNYGMCGRAYQPRQLWTWPMSRLSVMGGEQAAGVLASVKIQQIEREGRKPTPQEIEEIRRPILEKYEKEGNPYYGSSRLWDDGILLPEETRQALILGISASLNAPIQAPKYGIFRM
ncbi:MAG: carboxyl transferase domain-containing protein [Planctomycetota bacterium]